MQRGDIDQMSFAFTLTDEGDDWAIADDGTVIRTLRADGADELFDTSVVTFPAYRATNVDMRSQLESAITLGRLPELVEAVPIVELAAAGDGSASQENLGEEEQRTVATPEDEPASVVDEEPGEISRVTRLTPDERQALQAGTAAALAAAKERRREAERRKYQFTATRQRGNS
jgi:hypothetical protein